MFERANLYLSKNQMLQSTKSANV